MLRNVKITRNAILFSVGLGGVIYQTLVENVDRPALLVMFGAMMGLPAFLGREEKKAVEKDKPKAPEVESKAEVEE